MTAAQNDDLLDRFLAQRGHDTSPTGWEIDFNKKQCPECGGLHHRSATECSVCGWQPR